MKLYIRSSCSESKFESNIESIYFCTRDSRDIVLSSIFVDTIPIFASISSREITRSMIRVKSSNVWSYCINIRKNGDAFGDVYVQFKGDHGGPGDIYVYYDIPLKVWKKIISATSKGHSIWAYLRDNPNGYSKLTGDKRGKLRNAIN